MARRLVTVDFHKRQQQKWALFTMLGTADSVPGWQEPPLINLRMRICNARNLRKLAPYTDCSPVGEYHVWRLISPGGELCLNLIKC